MATCGPTEHNYQDGGNVIFCTKCGHMNVKPGVEGLSELLEKCSVAAEKAKPVSGTPQRKTEKAEPVSATPQRKTEKAELVSATPQRKTEKAEPVSATPQRKTEKAEPVSATPHRKTWNDVQVGNTFEVVFNGQNQRWSANSILDHTTGYIQATLLGQFYNGEWCERNGTVAPGVDTTRNELVAIY